MSSFSFAAGVMRSSIAAILFLLPGLLQSGVFEFAGEIHGVDVITHPTGYDGTGNKLIVTVGIAPSSIHADRMAVAVQNAIQTWNQLIPTLGNIVTSGNRMPVDQFDFESVTLHELGHCIGLSHPNLAVESGLTGNDKNYTASTKGANQVYDLNPGIDGIIGSSDDIRGDDVNLHWFPKGVNNPFLIPQTVDQLTYSRDLGDLPVVDHFAVNADRDVSEIYPIEKTEAVMQQGILAGEWRRTLAADDVATLRLGMSGLDRIAGTADDYTVELHYAGFTDNADITLAFDDKVTFSACEIQADFLGGNHNHLVIQTGNISFNSNFPWYFETELRTPESTPAVAIRINDQAYAQQLQRGDTVKMSVTLDPQDRNGNLSDYWVKAMTPFGTFWLNENMQFVVSEVPIRAYGGPLVHISGLSLFEDAAGQLPPGLYSVYFAVDDNMDGIYDGTFKSSTIFTIQSF